MTDYDKLKQIIEEIPILIDAKISSSDPKFQAWKTKAERFLIHKYGQNSYEHNQFVKTSFALVIYAYGTPHSEFVKACQDGLRKSQAIFQTYLADLEEEQPALFPIQKAKMITKIFIVHGHDGELKQSVARIIEKQNIETIILSEKENLGTTIIEKIEKNSDVGCAICLFTSDDEGRAKSADQSNSRARQNVIFETGFFIGKLGREHVIILADKNIEMPSDLSGVVYTNTTNWEIEVLKELKAIGYPIDFNKVF